MRAKSFLFISIAISLIMLSSAVLIVVIYLVMRDTSNNPVNAQMIYITPTPLNIKLNSGAFTAIPEIESYWSTPPDDFEGGYFPTITPNKQ